MTPSWVAYLAVDLSKRRIRRETEKKSNKIQRYEKLKIIKRQKNKQMHSNCSP